MRRILSIDGGGIKGVFPASFLASIEDALGDRVANYFDLIAGTSTGGIIALGLGIGLSAKEILTFYEELGPRVFKGTPLLRSLRGIGLSKYSQAPLKEALQAQFGERRLGESTKRLVIPSLNLETGKVYIYKTAHHPRFERDYKEKIVDIALATAAAPTYFPTQRSAAGTPLIDGGMWANNPVGLAVVEAVGVLEWSPTSLRVLSLGCTKEPMNVNRGRRLALGAAYWVGKITSVFMAAQSSSSLGTASILVGHENIVRINPYVARGRFGLDAIKEVPSLRGLGDSEARDALPSLRPMFFDTHAEPFEPYWKLNN